MFVAPACMATTVVMVCTVATVSIVTPRQHTTLLVFQLSVLSKLCS
jgi:hypothetical protein